MTCRPSTPWSPDLIDEAVGVPRVLELRALHALLPPGPVYLAGPMRGLPQFNVRAFYRAEGELVAAGFAVFNPARNDQELGVDLDAPLTPGQFRDALRWDVNRVLDASALVLLPGWRESEGATLEVTLARALRLPVWELVRPAFSVAAEVKP